MIRTRIGTVTASLIGKKHLRTLTHRDPFADDLNQDDRLTAEIHQYAPKSIDQV